MCGRNWGGSHKNQGYNHLVFTQLDRESITHPKNAIVFGMKCAFLLLGKKRILIAGSSDCSMGREAL
jgi:hypothetical protein